MSVGKFEFPFSYPFSSLKSGLEQSMKPMIGKSIDQSMTIDAS